MFEHTIPENLIPRYYKLRQAILKHIREGKYRPGHFKGVAIVVKKLFDAVEPDRAYFGEKDFQQLVIIKHMVKTLNIPVKIISCETVRDEDGLAMSSRNARLTIGERDLAPKIYDVLMYTRSNAGTVPNESLLISLRKSLIGAIWCLLQWPDKNHPPLGYA